MSKSIQMKLMITIVATVIFGKITVDNLLFAADEHSHNTTNQTCSCPDCVATSSHATCAHADDEQQVHNHDDHADDDHDHEDHAHDAPASAEHDHDHAPTPAARDHDDHDHESAPDQHDHSMHADDAHAHDEHDHDETIRLDQAAENMIGLQTVTAQRGTLRSPIRLNGQIRLNQDTLAHIVPLTTGIVRQVNHHIGDLVRQGDILAWIESTELAQAKVNYLDIQAELSCCALDLARARTVHDDTLKLMEFLQSEPSLDELRHLDNLEAGENRSKLITAYTNLVIAASVYEREKSLYEKNITSQEDFLHAQHRWKKAEAEYLAALDTIRFQIKQNLLEALGTRQRQEFALKGAERTLIILGQSDVDIRQLDALSLSTSGSQHSPQNPCPDPDCAVCLAKAASVDPAPSVPADLRQLGWYPLKAGINGTILDKHITLGERLGEDSIAFTIADLDTVWVDLDVFPRDLPYVNVGREIILSVGPKNIETTITFVSPVLGPQTRTATARAVLDNRHGRFYPSQFLTARIHHDIPVDAPLIPQQAVQTIDTGKVVFVRHDQTYEPRPVTLGRSGIDNVEIIAGLDPGEQIVTEGAFELKAKIVTSTLDSHAGHGH